MSSLAETFKKIIFFLKKNNYKYTVIGGIASSVIGNPRFTGDIDICLLINADEAEDFLIKAGKTGFKVNKNEMLGRIKETGTFQIQDNRLHVDFIIVSTEFEKKVIERSKKTKIYNITALLPTPEDLILLKIVPGRPIDINDIENIVIRHKGKLDIKYLNNWAMKLSDESQNMRIYNELQRILKNR